TAQVALKLGFAHLKLGVQAMNETPLGAVIAAPRPEDRELFCRHGLKWSAKIPARKIRAALKEIQTQRRNLRRGKHTSDSAFTLVVELDLAARMAEQSCQYMLWQQAVAAGKTAKASALAKQSIRELERLEKDFKA